MRDQGGSGFPAARAVGAKRIATQALIWAGVAVAMILLALANPLNGDEDQWFGAALLSGSRPFVDFLHLQTPLQVYLWAPVAPLFVGYNFIAMRIASALLGAGVLALVYIAQRQLQVERRIAAACTALLGCCYSFQFGAAVVRNDILPALLLTAAILIAGLALRAPPRGWPAWGAVALLLGLATSAKLSYAMPLGAAGLFVLAQVLRGRLPFGAVAAYGAGALVGLAPILLAWRAAPEAFVYGVVTYAMTAPFEWYQAQGRAWALRLDVKLLATLGALALGPALGAIVLLADAALRGRWAAETAQVRFLQILVVAGFAAALLPTPTNFQYMLPALPPLFVLLGIKARELLATSRNLFGGALLVLGAVAGCSYGLFVATKFPVRGILTPFELTRHGHWIGDRLRAAGAHGFVGTLWPHGVLDSGFPLDPRFATGYFVFRSSSKLDSSLLERIHAIGVQNLTAALDAKPPGALLVGPPDDPLRGYAIARGYRKEKESRGGFELYIRPTAAP